jgi:protein-tyrosine phosphatase
MRTVLFLGTGNYYRSRFAEELFNHHAARAGLSWAAKSRALAIERLVNNVDCLSPFALEALEKRGLPAKDGKRFPQQCAVADLESADLIVALMDSEHRPLIRERFSGWEDRVKYWQVGDIDVTEPDRSLSTIESEIASLIEKMKNADALAVKREAEEN